MTDAQFSRPGAVDLSSLTQAAQSPSPSTGSSWVTDVNQASFDSVAQQSLQHPVIVEFWSPRAHGADQLSRDLTDLTQQAQGSWLLARVNVDAEPQLAQALQIQAVPTVVALIGGQLAPLFQGTRPAAEIKAALDQVMQVAVANGMVAKARPVSAPVASEADSAAAADPRFEAADAALERGDFAAAVAEYDRLLAQTPHDVEVIASRAQAALLVRSAEHDPTVIMAQAQARPLDLEAQFAAADVELMAGDADQAFSRLIELVRATSGDEREQVRVRLLELFAMLGNADARVLKARRALSTALF